MSTDTANADTVRLFDDTMAFRPSGRLPLIEWAAWWDKTIARWRTEGLPEELAKPEEIRAWFGLDSYVQLWIGAKRGIAFGTLEEYEALRPQFYQTPVFDAARLEELAAAQRRGETVVWITLDGFFWFARGMLGIERHLYAFVDEPQLMHAINRDLADFHLRAIEELCRVCTPNFMTFAEDMTYNKGPMISKACFDEFMAPYYATVVPELKRRGILTLVDSDGDVAELIPWLEEAGIEGLLPFERAAGCDVAAIRARHPNFRMIGGFDKRVMQHGEQAMRAEFERLLPVMRQGGFIPSVDHQTPPHVSIEQYRCYVALLREYCQRAAAKR